MSRTRSLKLIFALVLALVAVAACDRPVDAGAPTAAVPDNPWIAPQAELNPAAEIFPSCASCHMADASGRTDGTVPRLAGQLEAVLMYKMYKMHGAAVTLPVMQPYARSLSVSEANAVVHYVSQMPVPQFSSSATEGETHYRLYCAGCHGQAAEGNDVLRVPRLCGQHAAYIVRRMGESVDNRRGDADPAMAALVQVLSVEQRDQIAAWLAEGHCAPQEAP